MTLTNDSWLKIQQELQETTTKITFDTWFKNLKFISFSEDTLYLEVETAFFKNMIINHGRIDIIKECAKNVLNKSIEIILVTSEEKNQFNFNVHKPQTEVIEKDTSRNNLTEKYVFENFVVGNSNQMAYALSVAVAEQPGTVYNPLFLYGNSGLGKTHLMHAIAHYVLDHQENAKVLYTSCEQFTNELISAIKTNQTESFRNKYRKIDVLLIDDIQFIIGTASTQTEFFHTFNDLTQDNKQIIICSDKHPNEMPTLEDRVRTRFNGGMVIDIAPPDFETRTAILEKKAETDNIKLPKDVAQFIAQLVKSNIRELEGSLNRVHAFSNIVKKEITIELVKEALKDIINGPLNFEISVESIQEIVAKYYNVTVNDLMSNKKNQPIAKARQVSMYLCCQLLNDSLTNISKRLERTHATVIHGKQKVTSDIEKDESFKKEIIELETKIKNMK